MKTKLSIFLCAIIMLSSNLQAKEYLGIDLGNTTFEQIKQKLEKANIHYTLSFEKDDKGNEIVELPSISFNQYPDWERFGNLLAAEIHFYNGKVDSFSVHWNEKKEDLLFQNLSADFSKKFIIYRIPATDGGRLDTLTYGSFMDEDKVRIELQKEKLWRNKINPFDWHYVTTVNFKEFSLSRAKKMLVNNINKGQSTNANIVQSS